MDLRRKRCQSESDSENNLSEDDGSMLDATDIPDSDQEHISNNYNYNVSMRLSDLEDSAEEGKPKWMRYAPVKRKNELSSSSSLTDLDEPTISPSMSERRIVKAKISSNPFSIAHIKLKKSEQNNIVESEIDSIREQKKRSLMNGKSYAVDEAEMLFSFVKLDKKVKK